MNTLVYLCIMVSLIVVQAADLQLAVAQIGIQPSVRSRDACFLPAPRALQRLLSEGRTAIREGRYADGIGSLGAILQDDTDTIPEDLRGQDFFIRLGRDVDPKNTERDPKGNRARGNQTSARYTSIKSEVINELNLLPEDGRKALEILFGFDDRQLLDEGMTKQR